MKEEHEWFGAITSCDIVELYPIGCDVLVAAEAAVQKTARGN